MLIVTVAQLARDSSDRRIERRDLVRELPPLPELEELLASGELSSTPFPVENPAFFEAPELASKVGTVVLDLSVGEFTIRAGEPGEPIRVEADYESDAFELRETFTEGGDGAWTYEISFRPKGGILGMMFRGAGNNPRNNVEIVLPRGRPLDLVGDLGLGLTEADLGGLLLRTVDLEAGTGEHIIEFSEPLAMPMDYFHIEKGVGEMQILDLGNAQPREIDLEMRVGELRVDMSGGPWSVDSLMRVAFGVGESRIKAPENVRLELKRASVLVGDRVVRRFDNKGIPEDAPTVAFDLSVKIGSLVVSR